MKLVEPSVTRVEETGIKLVEEAARNCYRSVPREGADAMQFADALYKAGHLAPLEFARYNISCMSLRYICEIMEMPPSEAVKKLNAQVNGTLKVDHSDYITLKVTTSLQVANELVRHRRFSFCQESTRYCNYSKEKFGGLTFVLPPTLDKDKKMYLVDSLGLEERIYLDAIEVHNYTPQEAAMFLPKQTATTIYMQGHRGDWPHFLDLRYFETTGKVLPEMKHIATLIKEQL